MTKKNMCKDCEKIEKIVSSILKEKILLPIGAISIITFLILNCYALIKLNILWLFLVSLISFIIAMFCIYKVGDP